MTRLAAAMACLALAAPSLSWAQARPMTEAERALAQATFKCRDGGDLVARFASQDAQLVAIVDAGDGPRTLAATPWTGGPAVLTWTDGRRTLTWSPGVQIMWMDGSVHRMCGRGGHRH
jgi:hypothetical protein